MDQLVTDLIADVGVADAVAWLEDRLHDCDPAEAIRCCDLIDAVAAKGRH
jgi:hypothetical protein